MRGKLPKFDGAEGVLIQRSTFLDGTYKAHFGPGQWPAGMTDTPLGYKAPTNWPKMGTLLRVPQMVCFQF